MSASGQKRKPLKPALDTAKQMNNAILRNDSLIAVECKLPLIDSADDRPTFSLDGKMMVFGSRRPPIKGETWRVPQIGGFLGNWDCDIYYRLLTDTGWTVPINPGPPINNSGSQINPTIHPRGDILYYVGQGPQIAQSLITEDNVVTFDTVKDAKGKVKKVNQKNTLTKHIGTPTPVYGLINNAYINKANKMYEYALIINQRVEQALVADSDLFRRAPDALEVHRKEQLIRLVNNNGAAKFYAGISRCENTVTPDGRFAIFSENFGKTGEYGLLGEGDDDLWIVNISENGNWDTVQSPNGKVNSPYAETYPFIAADNATLYFSSDRPCRDCPPGASGGDDIYMSRLTDTGFSKPQILPPPFNSSYGDYGFSISPDGETAYFVSNRTGKSKFYQVSLRPQDSTIAPKPIVIMSGKVTDKITGKPVKAQIFIDELTDNKNSFSVFSDSVTGTYILAMQRGHRLGLQVLAKGYLPQSERFSLPAKGSFDRTKLDFQLQPIEVGAVAEFKNVYFESGKSELLRESKLELDRIAKFLVQSKNASIEIQGHTDDVGNDDYNTKLSLERATTVMNYIVSKGIPARRLESKGFGKTKPLAKGTDDASRAKNRRVEMVVTSYSQ